jgi:hypothetical protein
MDITQLPIYFFTHLPIHPSTHLFAYKPLFCTFFADFCAFCASLRLIRTVFTRLLKKVNNHSSIILNHLYGLHSFAFSLTSYGISSTKDNVRKNKLFMQNKANFQKVKLNVTKVLTKDYGQMDTWSIRKNKAKTNPIQTQYHPNSSPIAGAGSCFLGDFAQADAFSPSDSYEGAFRNKIAKKLLHYVIMGDKVL